MLRFSVLGPLRAWRDDEELDLGPPSRRAVLGLLVLAGGAYVSRSELVDALWGDDPPATAANVLQTHVKHLRRLVEPGRLARARSEILRHTNGGYVLRAAESDVDTFRRHLRQADGEQTVPALAAALRCWHGRPLADLPALAAHPKVIALTIEHRLALIRYGEGMIARGAAAEVVAPLSEAAAQHPLDERVHATLINAMRAAGQRAAAFDVHATISRALADDLGLDPGPELASAYLSLLGAELSTHARNAVSRARVECGRSSRPSA
ncbi:BTAD domain-containing putative transcriptional regulator [Actinokineospora auranticolor]|uniref:DNA-binding SARP family transcriptional activator n=1 Tax=Actinokineospora auranticolor TaxID=155976 RepID=A0A2S6GQ30_9PSEU|nr:BTAD domain-containing putative transcriptional regulator [Actinokineospora auranticolor]PPK67221.1 DNA-binding SARP family transcriptional activator [Actinokineospora auranticolor]